MLWYWKWHENESRSTCRGGVYDISLIDTGSIMPLVFISFVSLRLELLIRHGR